jgi:hypothetical protein
VEPLSQVSAGISDGLDHQKYRQMVDAKYYTARREDAISNKRNNLPNGKPTIVPSHDPILCSDIEEARTHRLDRPDCFMAPICPQSYKILEIEPVRGSGRFIPRTQFDNTRYEDKIAGRVPWALIPEELVDPQKFALDKY